MVIYVVNLLFILFFATIFETLPLNRLRKKLLLGGILFCQFSLIAILRGDSVGADLGGYLKVFEDIRNMTWQEASMFRFEYGYLSFNKLLGYISENNQVLIIGVAIFILAGFFCYILKNSRIPWLSFFLFVALGYYTSSFNILRQFMAMAILVNCIDYVTKRQFFRFLIGVLVASCFHITAIVFLLLYPLSQIKITWTYFGIAFCFAFVVGHIVGKIVLGYLTSTYFELYAGNMLSGSGYGLLGLLLIITIGGLLLRPGELTHHEEVYYHAMIIACCLQVMSLQFSLFSRIVLYFWIHVIIFIPQIVVSIKDKGLKSLVVLSVCALSSAYFYFFILSNADGSEVIPYKFMWE